MEWKISRVTTSKMMERRSGASVRPATSQASRAEAANFRLMARAAASRDHGSTPVLAAHGALGNGRTTCWIRSPRPRTKIRLATPVAARASTEISPKVSHARMSTRVTLTMFSPPPPS